MALILKDRVRETTTTIGTGPITLNGAVTIAYQRFGAVMSIGDTCWYFIVLPGSAWESGVGTYSALNTLTRTTVIESSNANAAVSFAAGTKDVVISQPASKSNVQNNTFPSGTLMLFQQTNAPIYWTKQVTHNDKTLRVVSGAAGSGGSNSFTSVLSNAFSTANYTNVVATMPSHAHTSLQPTQTRNDGTSVASLFAFATSQFGGSQGGDGAHAHALQLAVQYVDLIIASKD